VLDVPPERETQRVDKCSHSKSLPYGAAAIVVLYWVARVPPLETAIPHIDVAMNTLSVSFTGMVGWQTLQQTRVGVKRWWSRHVQITGRATFSLGKPPEDGDAGRGDSS
jgi:hypothetical protein